MITSGEWLSPTRAIGLLAYGTAVSCCAIAWIRTKARHGASQLAAAFTLIESALLLDMVFDLRWRLHQLFVDFAKQEHEYALRRLPQEIVITLLVGLLLFSLLAARRLFRDTFSARLAVSGVLLSVILWCVEVVSLHAVDHILYHSLGGVMTVTLLWILSCSMTSVGILLDPR
jgi:membrane-bound metal-dependent hydrolase YbcI (DUF457 family)